ncbi:hypothetical protein DY000_02054434 [Brassica cretica]|uniref:Uncharacterized protein n=1 Tax=Brassica cretica TaxID=69181 RepID=A0ABQ7ACQ1_BRACR|nr:hypothetical protein DY000_02054434 [Brassica cretica]
MCSQMAHLDFLGTPWGFLVRWPFGVSPVTIKKVAGSTLCRRGGTVVIKISCARRWPIRFLGHALGISGELALRALMPMKLRRTDLARFRYLMVELWCHDWSLGVSAEKSEFWVAVSVVSCARRRAVGPLLLRFGWASACSEARPWMCWLLCGGRYSHVVCVPLFWSQSYGGPFMTCFSDGGSSSSPSGLCRTWCLSATVYCLWCSSVPCEAAISDIPWVRGGVARRGSFMLGLGLPSIIARPFGLQWWAGTLSILQSNPIIVALGDPGGTTLKALMEFSG